MESHRSVEKWTFVIPALKQFHDLTEVLREILPRGVQLGLGELLHLRVVEGLLEYFPHLAENSLASFRDVRDGVLLHEALDQLGLADEPSHSAQSTLARVAREDAADYIARE